MATFPLKDMYPALHRVILGLPAIKYDFWNFLRTGKLEVTHKFQAFRFYGDLSKKQAEAALKPLYDPVITVVPLKDWGFYPGNGNTIEISMVAANQYEIIAKAVQKGSRSKDGAAWISLGERARRTMESIILHEIVHWGDFRFELTKREQAHREGYEDTGQLFMRDAYPKFIKFTPKVKGSRRPADKYLIADLSIKGWLGRDAKGNPYKPTLSTKPPPIEA